MSLPPLPAFRTGDVLATVFTGTLSERYGDPVERIPTPQRLLDWLAANALTVPRCTRPQLDRARELREAIHLAGTAAATHTSLPRAPLTTINEAASGGRASAQLTTDAGRVWLLGTGRGGRVEDALVVVAADAIDLLSPSNRDRLSLCASPTCRAVFLDTSQSHTRRWCDMNSCGNRQKKARWRAAHRTG